jgi:hypothetical protein
MDYIINITVQVATKIPRHKGQIWLLPPYLKEKNNI